MILDAKEKIVLALSIVGGLLVPNYEPRTVGTVYSIPKIVIRLLKFNGIDRHHLTVLVNS